MYDWQLPLVLLILASALGYLAWAGFRTWKKSKSGCGGGCSCSSPPDPPQKNGHLIPTEQLTIRRRD